MTLFVTTILDHRGRRVPLLACRHFMPFSTLLPPPTRRFILEDIKSDPNRPGLIKSLVRGLAVVLIVCFGFVLVTLFILNPLRLFVHPPDQMSPWLLPYVGVQCVVILLASLLLKHRLDAPITVRALLVHHRCPSCGYRIAEVPPDPADGCTVCPECSAAWKLPPIHS